MIVRQPVRRGPYPEITWPAVLVGYVVGSLIAVSIGYLSLKLGFSIEGSELAAILGFGVLRGAMRRRSIIENNINQTLASAVNGASGGMMFSIPALFILGYTDFNKPLLVFACIAGGILGISFIIPLRKQMIDFDRLAYPGGIATAAILKAPGAGIRKAKLLLGAAVPVVTAVRHDLDRRHDLDFCVERSRRSFHGGGLGVRGCGDVCRDGPGHRLDAGSQDRVSGRGHPTQAADRAILSHLAGTDFDHGFDRGFAPSLWHG